MRLLPKLRGFGRAGEDAGVRAARGEWDAAGEVELPGPRDRGPGYLGVHGAPLAGGGRSQALAAPVLGLPRDPYFAVKAAHVFGLYERIWEARPLGGDEYVLSADEKPGVQVRRRIHPGLPPGPGRPMRVENEYARCGTRPYLAAYDVHRGQVTGRCEPTTSSRSRFQCSGCFGWWTTAPRIVTGQRPPG